MTDVLIERAMTVERAAQRALDGIESPADVRRALSLLYGTITARECRHGGLMLDANGRAWGERLDALDRMVRTARDAGELERALKVVLADLEPLTGSARREEVFC